MIAYKNSFKRLRDSVSNSAVTKEQKKYREFARDLGASIYIIMSIIFKFYRLNIYELYINL